LNIRRVSDVRQIEIHTGERLVPGSSPLEVEIAVAKLRKYNSPGIDQIPAELIEAGSNILRSEVRELNNSIRNKKALSEQGKEPIIASIHKKACKTDCSDNRGISLLSTSYNILYSILFYT
jgi:hypothetical protein